MRRWSWGMQLQAPCSAFEAPVISGGHPGPSTRARGVAPGVGNKVLSPPPPPHWDNQPTSLLPPPKANMYVHQEVPNGIPFQP